MHKCSSVYSERGVPLPVLTSGGAWVGVRACKNSIRVPPSLCDVTQTYYPANPPPCACRTRLRELCSTRPLRTVRPEPLHPHEATENEFQGSGMAIFEKCDKGPQFRKNSSVLNFNADVEVKYRYQLHKYVIFNCSKRLWLFDPYNMSW
jgi:hypothetical protein